MFLRTFSFLWFHLMASKITAIINKKKIQFLKFFFRVVESLYYLQICLRYLLEASGYCLQGIFNTYSNLFIVAFPK